MADARGPAQGTSRVVSHLTSRVAVVALCSLAPIVNFAAANAQEPRFSAGRALQYALAIGAAGYLLALVLEKVARRAPRCFGRAFVGLAVLVTLNGYLIDQLVFGGTFEAAGLTPRVRYIVLIYGLLLIAALPVAWMVARRPAAIAVGMAGIAGFVATDAASYAYRLYATAAGRASVAQDVAEAGAPRPKTAAVSGAAERPNIYFVIPDMMVGRHMFPAFGVDYGVFRDLADMGFVAPADAYANAPVTTFSMMHTLSMGYFLEDRGRVGPAEMAAIQQMVEEPKLYKELKERGYRIVAVDDGYYGHCGAAADRCISRGGPTSDRRYQDIRFLDRTPFFRALDVLDMKLNLFDPPLNLWAYPDRMEVPEIVERLPAPESGPFLYVLHHALPHYPMRFDRDCRPRRFADVDVAYGAQLACAAKWMGLLAGKIVDSDPGAIVVIQADHGISFHGQNLKPVSALTEAELEENFNIFAAYRLPAGCRRHIGDVHTSVNTFRVVLACLDGTEPELLENRLFAVYYPHWPSGGHVREWRLR